jgi:tetratricopeptide (TPR) repeat protein
VNGQAPSFPLGTTQVQPGSVEDGADLGKLTPLAVGQQIGRYKLLAELGSGGMGVVYRALDPQLDRELAIKVLNLPKTVNVQDHHLKRFLREAQLTGQLEHPGIVPVHELGRAADGRWFLAMKVVRGQTLAARIRYRARQRGRGDLGSDIDVLVKVCDALAFAHNRGVIHRDLKPDNIMVGEFGEVQVMDWGLAKRLGATDELDEQATWQEVPDRPGQMVATLDGAVMGTPQYMAPEQARGEIAQLDQRSDIYALGAILYEVLTGTTPYGGATLWAVLSDVAEGRYVPLRRRRRNIPFELEAVVVKAMAFAPADRFTDVSELRAELQRYLAGTPLICARYGWADRAWRVARKHRRVLIATIVTAVIATTAFSWISNTRKAGQAAAAEEAARRALLAGDSERAERLATEVLLLMPGNSQAKVLLGEAALARERLARQARDAERLETLRREIASAQNVRDRASDRDQWFASRNVCLDLARDIQRLDPTDRTNRELLVTIALELADRLVEEESWSMALLMLDHAAMGGLDTAVLEQRREAIKTQRSAIREEQQRRTLELLDGLRKSPGEEGLHDEQVLELIRMPYPHIVELLLPAVLDDEPRVAQLAIEALGKIGDTSTRAWVPLAPLRRELPDEVRAWRADLELERNILLTGASDQQAQIELDAVELLSLRLIVTSLAHELELAVDIVWALGRLRDARADRSVFIMRQLAGTSSTFWRRTALPYRWLPSGTENASVEAVHALLQKRRYAEAVEQLDLIIAKQPKNADAWIARSLGREHLGELERALADVDTAIELRPNQPNLHCTRARLLDRSGMYERALAEIELALKLDPTMVEAFYERGSIHHRRGKAQLALADFEQALTLVQRGGRRPADLAMIHIGRGDAFLMLDELPAARRAAEIALEIEPQSPDALQFAAAVAFRQERFEDAAQLIEASIRRAADRAAPYIVRSALRVRTGDSAGALADLDRAIELGPNLANAYNDRGALHRNEGRLVEAEVDFLQAARLDPTSAVIQFNLGALYNALGRAEEAEAAFDAGLAAVPDDFDCLLGKTKSVVLRGEAAQAVVYVERAVAARPRSGAARVLLAQILIGQARYEEARAAIEAAEQLIDPTDPARGRLALMRMVLPQRR